MFLVNPKKYSPSASQYAPIWICGDGRQVLICETDTNHLVNILKRYQRDGFQEHSFQEKYRDFYMEEIMDELDVRQAFEGTNLRGKELYEAKQLHRLVLGLPQMKPLPEAFSKTPAQKAASSKLFDFNTKPPSKNPPLTTKTGKKWKI
jgi:hypothetical protein